MRRELVSGGENLNTGDTEEHRVEREDGAAACAREILRSAGKNAGLRDDA